MLCHDTEIKTDKFFDLFAFHKRKLEFETIARYKNG